MQQDRRQTSGTSYIRFFGPVIQALKELGGSGRPAEVEALVSEALNISDEELSLRLKNGGSRFSNQVAWARYFLAQAGYIDGSKRGIWSLTEKGLNSTLSSDDAFEIFQDVNRQVRDARPDTVFVNEHSSSESIEYSSQEHILDQADHQSILLRILQELSPSGFERFCQRLLREAGFLQVIVTGRSGDGGIDGHGLLQVNPLVSFRVYFQCKRYTGSVSPNIVRDFRGAIIGRADKGIILTTGTFTSEARREAIRDGATPIELVDGEKLIEMLEMLELGVKPKTVYQVDEYFFEEFR